MLYGRWTFSKLRLGVNMTIRIPWSRHAYHQATTASLRNQPNLWARVWFWVAWKTIWTHRRWQAEQLARALEQEIKPAVQRKERPFLLADDDSPIHLPGIEDEYNGALCSQIISVFDLSTAEREVRRMAR